MAEKSAEEKFEDDIRRGLAEEERGEVMPYQFEKSTIRQNTRICERRIHAIK